MKYVVLGETVKYVVWVNKNKTFEVYQRPDFAQQCHGVQECCNDEDNGQRCQIPAELERPGSCNENYYSSVVATYPAAMTQYVHKETTAVNDYRLVKLTHAHTLRVAPFPGIQGGP